METIKINFKGHIDVDKDDFTLMIAEDGSPVDKADVQKMSAKQIIDGLESGFYMIDFVQAYVNATSGEEEYEFSVVEVTE